MAYWDATFPVNGYVLRITANYAGMSVDGNYTSWSCALEILKGSGTGRFNNNASSWQVNVNGYAPSGSFTYDFRNYSSLTLWSGVLNFGHDAAGYLSFNSYGAVQTAGGNLGNAAASGDQAAPRVPKPPLSATSGGSIDQIAPASLRYNFAWGGDDGGSGITGYTLQVATDASFTNVVKTVAAGGSPTTITGLAPATPYWVRSRAENARGAGPWGATANATTLGGVKYPVSGAWTECQVLYGVNGAWVPCEVRYGRAGEWVGLTS